MQIEIGAWTVLLALGVAIATPLILPFLHQPLVEDYLPIFWMILLRSLEETKAGLRLKPPKTTRGRRKISLPPATAAMLRAHKVQQMEFRLVVGMGKPDATTLVFSDIEGRLLKSHTVSRAWRRAVVALKLPAVTFHALRHTHVSALISAGVDILTISRRLGHSKASVTLDVYGHLIGWADEAAAKAIEGMLK